MISRLSAPSQLGQHYFGQHPSSVPQHLNSVLASVPELGTSAPELGTSAPELGPVLSTRARYLSTRARYLSTRARYLSSAPELGISAPELGTSAPELGTSAPELGPVLSTRARNSDRHLYLGQVLPPRQQCQNAYRDEYGPPYLYGDSTTLQNVLSNDGMHWAESCGCVYVKPPASEPPIVLMGLPITKSQLSPLQIQGASSMTRASSFECYTMKKILMEYEAALGQAINFAKSGIFFSSNVPLDIRDHISSSLGVFSPLNMGRYLEAPSLIGRKKKEVFSYLRQRIWKRINGWKGKFLSKATDVKAIAAIPLSLRHNGDMLIWNFNKNDMYSVKSGYRVAMELKHLANAFSVVGNWSCIWKLMGFMKCKFDAAIFSDRRKFGVGMVIRDFTGGFICCSSKWFNGMRHAKEAEAIGLREALSRIHSMGMDNVIFEMDAQEVVHAMKNSRSDISEFGSIIQACISLLSTGNFHVDFIKRQVNEVAHALARASHSHASLSVWPVPPPHIGALLLVDLQQLS
ncbi:LINE-1 reverse transcriptase isogeny [Cinnamomum micranthum f. kanehirae]|uniref:LINE-1 reverse transcriptase isogeny n=1 Tax=Cinnamomum micranthum f. kanehirae TaxID=337451 RepID=A0A443NDZ3_9MAGN|nr:LINE-1 reverse transcriptase isogeny [Cinnamomum micranthum f. kanehirae]